MILVEKITYSNLPQSGGFFCEFSALPLKNEKKQNLMLTSER